MVKVKIFANSFFFNYYFQEFVSGNLKTSEARK